MRSCTTGIAALSIVLILVLPGSIVFSSLPGQSGALSAAPLYSGDPNHIWNRLFRLFYIRTTVDGHFYGGDELDPYLWLETRYLISGPSHQEATKLLDEFLRQHAERLVSDPLQRALMQRDLWAVHDWLTMPGQRDPERRRALSKPLAEIIRRLALKEDEIAALPDNFHAAILAGKYPQSYDAANPAAPFLPDLFQPDGPWVCVGQQQDQPIAAVHLQFFQGRSAFLVFLRLPGGRKETVAYLEKLRSIPSRRKPVPMLPGGSPEGIRDPEPPQFPPGTQVALVRQMVVVSDQGRPVPTRITESVELRTYHSIPLSGSERYAAGSQDFVEFTLNRQAFFEGKDGGLRAVRQNERRPSTFASHGWDQFEAPISRNGEVGGLVLRSCFSCHQGAGVHSFASFSHEQFPPMTEAPTVLVESTPAREAALTLQWRQKHRNLPTP